MDGMYLTITDMYDTRTMHQNTSMTSIGTEARPEPRRIAAMQWESARRK